MSIEERMEEYKKDLEKDLEEDLGKDLEKITKNQKNIMLAISNNSKITQRELSGKIGISEKNIRNNIVKLKKRGLLKRIGPDRGGYWEVI